LCDTNDRGLLFTASAAGYSGFNTNSVDYCTTRESYVSDGEGSGSHVNTLSVCDSTNRYVMFNASANGFSGFSNNGIGYCSNQTFSGGNSAIPWNSVDLCDNRSAFGGESSDIFSSTNFCLNPLPVEMIYFEAQKNDTVVVLFWKTASEVNNNYFAIERAGNDLFFSQIGLEYGHGNSNMVNTYSFIDYNPIQGTNHYRLRQVDFDGEFEYSEIRTIEFQSAMSIGTLIVRPTLIGESENIFIQWTGEEILNTQISVYSVSGTLLFSYHDNIDQNFNEIDCSQLAAGMYFISIGTPYGLLSTRFIKQ